MAMRNIRIRMDEELAEGVEECARRLGVTLSGFARQALRDALARCEEAEEQERQVAGYRRIPPTSQEFAIPEDDRVWGNDANETW